MFSLPLLLLSALAPLSLAHAPLTHLVLSSRSQCQPFETTFAPGVVSASPGTPFLALSPPDSYSTDAHNLQLYLTKPSGTVTTTDGVNNVVGEGATVNSTFTFLHGRITYTLAAPVVPGVVTAAIFIGTLIISFRLLLTSSDVADEGDEVDVELLGGDPSHWQTNVYAPSPSDNGPLWGVFGEIEGFSSGTIKQSREYTVDWNAERIMWSVDGQAVRTVTKGQ